MELPGLSLPQPDLTILSATGDQPSILGERHAVDQPGVADESPKLAASSGVPQFCRPIPAAAGHYLTVPAQRHAPDPAGVSLHRQLQRTIRHPPQTHLAGGRRGGKKRAVRTECHCRRVHERLAQQRLGKMGIRQPGVLGLHTLQIEVAKR